MTKRGGAAAIRRLLIVATVALTSLGVGAAPADAYTVSDAVVVRPICFPLPYRTTVPDTWGAPRSGGRTHEGNDIMAPKGTPVVSPADGVVSFITTDAPLSGRAIGIKDAQGWQYAYVHLNNDTPGTDDGAAPLDAGITPGARVGDRVLRGQVIGWVGDSGNAESTPPHIHFEIRETKNDVNADNDVKYNPWYTLRDAPVCASPVARAAAVHPVSGSYTLTGSGHVAANGAPHHGEPQWGADLARDIAVMPGGDGYVVLDAWGGVHLFGAAAPALAAVRAEGPYWPERDVARSIALMPDGAGYLVLDGWGGVHRVGSARTSLAGVVHQAYWPGRDVAVDVAVMPDGLGYIVLDSWGGAHRHGSAAVRFAAATHQGYWPGWHIARELEISPSGNGYAVLEGWGGIHVTGSFPAITGGPHWGPAQPAWESFDVEPGAMVAVRSDGLARTSALGS